MSYSHIGYKIDNIDNSKSLTLLNLHLMDCYTQYKHKKHHKTLRKFRRPA